MQALSRSITQQYVPGSNVLGIDFSYDGNHCHYRNIHYSTCGFTDFFYQLSFLLFTHFRTFDCDYRHYIHHLTFYFSVIYSYLFWI